MSFEVVETVLFVIFAAVALAGALVMVWAANPVHSALGLLATMFSIAVFYVLSAGHFIAVVQIIVYAGAVLTLFLFVVMLIGVDKVEDRSERLPFQRQAAVILAVALSAAVLVAGRAAWVTGARNPVEPEGTIEAISDALFETWVLPFEITGLLFIVAAAGTIALAQYRTKERALPEEGP